MLIFTLDHQGAPVLHRIHRAACSRTNLELYPMIYECTGASCVGRFSGHADELLKEHQASGSDHGSREPRQSYSWRMECALPCKPSLLSRTRMVNNCIETPVPINGLSFLPPGALRRIAVLGEGGYGAVRMTD